MTHSHLTLGLLALLAMMFGHAPAFAAANQDEYEAGFQQRAEQIRRFMRTEAMINRLERPVWTDHTKYLWPTVLAIYLDGPESPHFERAREVMHGGAYAGTWIEEQHRKTVRYNREFFHFAAIGQARLLTQFEDLWEPQERLAVLRVGVPHGGVRAYATGTTNHRTMSFTSGYIVGQEAEKAGIDGGAGLKNNAANEIRAFAQRLFTNGMGEWDSSTYYAFTMVGFMNVYDFADDPEMRELARGVLDWLAANHALKYTHGIFGGPESRGGSAHEPVNAISDYFAWLWFGGAEKADEDFGGSAIYAIHAVLSDYRPHPSIVAMAQRRMETPFMSYGSKPTTPVANQGNFARETFFVHDDFTLGAIYERRDGWHYAANQAVYWKLAAGSEQNAWTLTGAGMSRTHSYTAGRDPWTQVAHHRGMLAQLSLVRPDAQERDDLQNRPGSFIAYPADRRPVQRDGVLFFDFDGVYVAARPLGGNLRFHEEEHNGRLIVEDQAEVGQPAGFVIEAGTAEAMGAFQQTILQATRMDFDRESLTVTYRGLEGHTLRMRYNVDGWHYEYFTREDRVEGEGHGRQPDVWVNDRQLALDEPWPVYSNPHMLAADGELRIAAIGDTPGLHLRLENGRMHRAELGRDAEVPFDAERFFLTP